LADVGMGDSTGTDPLAGVFLSGIFAGVAKESLAFSNFRLRWTGFVAEEWVGVETTSRCSSFTDDFESLSRKKLCHTLGQRCYTHSSLTTCGKWLF